MTCEVVMVFGPVGTSSVLYYVGCLGGIGAGTLGVKSLDAGCWMRVIGIMGLQGMAWGLGMTGIGNAEGVIWVGIDHVILITSEEFQKDGIGEVSAEVGYYHSQVMYSMLTICERQRSIWISREMLLASSSSSQEIIVVARISIADNLSIR
ncbi:hypothetical protein EAF00_007907 [Botryotinia globosa]|nr:hypothetical protein EAF00_007907 [Botryotinia globosa]